MIRYAITGLKYRTGDAARWGDSGVDYVQLRAKDVDAGELTLMAREMLAELGGRAKLLVNSRVDVAIAVGASGVHLTGREGELTPAQVRELFALAGLGVPVVSVSCHTLEDVARASEADLILFAPVFEKRVEDEVVVGGVGLEMLRAACEESDGVPVLAMGGVTWENAAACVQAGAAGVAGIRLFS